MELILVVEESAGGGIADLERIQIGMSEEVPGGPQGCVRENL